MGFLELIGIAIGLSMDAFAVSICKGFALKKAVLRKAMIAGLYFGCFQAMMPLIGFFAGRTFADYVNEYDHWIAFFLLFMIGGKMLLESSRHDDGAIPDSSFAVGTMTLLAVATSIDALMVGVSFAFMDVTLIWLYVTIIGVITFVMSFAGVKIGNVFGNRFQKHAEIAGGVVLILIGIKILLDGLEIL